MKILNATDHSGVTFFSGKKGGNDPAFPVSPICQSSCPLSFNFQHKPAGQCEPLLCRLDGVVGIQESARGCRVFSLLASHSRGFRELVLKIGVKLHPAACCDTVAGEAPIINSILAHFVFISMC